MTTLERSQPQTARVSPSSRMTPSAFISMHYSAIARTRALQRPRLRQRRDAHLRLRRPHALLLVALPRAGGLRCGSRRGGARREAEARRAADRAPAAGRARRVQPGRALGGERRVGQQRARVGRAHGKVRRDAARAHRGGVPAHVERGLAAAGEREQGQHGEGACCVLCGGSLGMGMGGVELTVAARCRSGTSRRTS